MLLFIDTSALVIILYSLFYSSHLEVLAFPGSRYGLEQIVGLWPEKRVIQNPVFLVHICLLRC